MKYLVTGGAGFIGSHLADRLAKEGNDVRIIDNLSTGKKENISPKAKFYDLDICDFEKIRPVFDGVDFVFHLAAVPRVPLSVEDPIGTSRVNIMGTINVFKAAAEAGAKKVIFSSSSAIYGDQKVQPIKEDAKPDPVSPYGLQKLVGEEFASIFTKLYSLPIISLRYFNVYGPRIDFDSDYGLVIGKFLKLKSENKPLTVFGDGEQTRGFCYVDDVVDANIKAAESSLEGGQAFNISREESYSINYLANLFGGQVQYLQKRSGDVLHTKADINLAKDFLGWQPQVALEEGLKKTIQWYENLN